MALVPVHSLLQLAEPVYVLNGTLTAGKGAVQVENVAGVVELPAEFRPQLAYFTRLRTAREVAAAGPHLGFDDDDVEEMVTSGLLWRALPGDDDQLIRQLERTRIQPNQAAVKGLEPMLRAVWDHTVDGALGPAVEQVSSACNLPDLIVWQHLAIELARLLRTGLATLNGLTAQEGDEHP